jgi:hypothetical protein
MIDIIELSFIPMYKVVGPLLFFMSLLLMVQEGFQLIFTVCLSSHHHEVPRMWGMGVCSLLGKTLPVYYLAFDQLIRVTEEVGENVGHKLSAKVSHKQNSGGPS